MDVNFKAITESLNTFHAGTTDNLKLALNLTKILKKIFEVYNERIRNSLAKTHPGTEKHCSLPIGFASSSILGNWLLCDFDNHIVDHIRPSYYGRYVDDVIMVIEEPKISVESPVDAFIEQYFRGYLNSGDVNSEYFVKVGGNRLPLQKDKLILQYFDHQHSRAGLELFKQELDERSSAFRFLPSDHIEKELDKFAYDVLYKGSTNKLRSVVGLAENQTELSKYISSHITAHRLCKLEKPDSVLKELKLFLKGVNALEFNRLWEKVYQYALITDQTGFLLDFYAYLSNEVDKLSVVVKKESDIKLTIGLRSDLEFYNRASLAVTIGLVGEEFSEPLSIDEEDTNKRTVVAQLVHNQNLVEMVRSFRASNLIRHHLVAWPLANYTNYKGDLTSEEEFVESTSTEIQSKKMKLSPRFIHFDEWQLFNLPNAISKSEIYSGWEQECIETYPNQNFLNDLPLKIEEFEKDNSGVVTEKIVVGLQGKHKKMRIGLANMRIHESDIEDAIREDSKPNVNFDRQKDLYSILNRAVKEGVDILAMPEVAIPVSWLPFVISHARKHQLGIVFGLEHWIVEGVAYNLIVEALPFRVDDKYKSCLMTARVKNHYAPEEIKLIKNFHLEPANESSKHTHRYHKVVWRGMSFAAYNCFELSDISHRGIFKSEIDLMFACVWNKDTNYYGHILESAVRDIHCYLVQSNTSQYGGSCVLQPTKTETATLLYVKGGTNASILTTDIDVAALRKFQYQARPRKGDKFKHLPPGYDSKRVAKRS